MAQYNGYVTIPHNSYEAWREATLGNGYDADGQYGNQCWDYCAELWHQYGLTLYTKSGGGGAVDCWNVSRQANSQPPFISFEGKTNIKRGDVVVFGRTRNSPNGHIGFADEDYNGTNYIKLLSQAPYSQGLHGSVFRTDWSLGAFLGVFRNTNWQAPIPPTPTKTKKKNKFPWIIAWHNWGGFKH